jgi:WW domain
MYAAEEPAPPLNVSDYSTYPNQVPTAAYSAPTSPYYSEPFSEKGAVEREQQVQRQYQLQREEYTRQQQQYYAAQQVQTIPLYPPDPSASPPPGDSQSMVGGGRSAKSLESSTTGQDGNSQNHSNGSEDGISTHDPASSVYSGGLTSNGGDPSMLGSTATTVAALPMHGDWIAIKDVHSDRFYYANHVTNESLWLPPLWEALQDGDGVLFFVDHGNQTTQREFPAEEARAYKDSLAAGH